MRSLASLLALAYALLVALWFGAFLFAGERTWWLVLLPAVIPWLFMLSFPFALALALLGRWNVGRWALLAVALLAAWLWGGLFLPPSPVPRAAASGAQLRVMTLNALVENAQHDRLVAAIASAGADIVAIQELSPGQATAISTRLGETYPYHALHPWGDPRGIGLWSRYPVTEIATYDEGDWENWLQHVVVEMAGRRIHIFNLHAWPVALDQPRQIMMSAALHQKQTEQLATTLARIPPVEPFVVAGDFNLVPLNRAYRPLTHVASDTWAAAGWGFGFTFPDQAKGEGQAFTLPPLVRIDYLWHSSSLHPRSIRILPSDTGSDHRGLVAEYFVP